MTNLTASPLFQTINDQTVGLELIGKTTAALKSVRKLLVGSKTYILGMAYKKEFDDHPENPSSNLIVLIEQGTEVSYCDPHVPQPPKILCQFKLCSPIDRSYSL